MKDAFNPYVISGIQSIVNLLEKLNEANVNLNLFRSLV